MSDQEKIEQLRKELSTIHVHYHNILMQHESAFSETMSRQYDMSRTELFYNRLFMLSIGVAVGLALSSASAWFYMR